MIRLLLGGLLLVASLGIGQDLSSLRVIGTAKQLSDELLDRSVKDANGQVCAGVAIATDLEGLSYDANNGVVKVVHSPGRDLLFLQTGERVVTVMKNGYKQLKVVLGDLGVHLAVGKVWQVEVTADKKLDQIPVNIVVTPQDADIIIDGVRRGAVRNLQIGAGKHMLRIEKEGYKSVEKSIEISVSNTLITETLQEVEVQAVTIRSVPTAAKFTVDGLDKGETDKVIYLYPGHYHVKVSKSGYGEMEKEIDVAEAARNEFTVTLEKNSGVLKLTTNPPGARILINKELYSFRDAVDLPPGKYKIEVEKSGYVSASEMVEVKRGETVTKVVSLIARTGGLPFSVQPLEAHVVLRKDGTVVAEWTGAKVLKSLGIGEYEIECSRKGYSTVTRKVTISEGKAIPMEIVMKAGKSKDVGSTEKPQVPADMVFVEGGSFEMGSNNGDVDEKPVHRVTVNSFFMDKCEVTVAQYRVCCTAMGRSMPSVPSWGWNDNDPIVNVSWDDAGAYARWAGKRLPTEAEWEYAARGGKLSKGYTYSGSNNLGDIAWYYDNSGSRVQPVGQKVPNELGLYDMSGNVWEWCVDWYDASYYKSSPSENPTGPTLGQYRVLRGGSWGSDSNVCRVAYRVRDDPGGRDSGIGFRCVQDVK